MNFYFSCSERLFRPIEVNRYRPVRHFTWVLSPSETFFRFPVVAVIDSLFFSIMIVGVSLLSIVVVVIEALLLIFILDVGRL